MHSHLLYGVALQKCSGSQLSRSCWTCNSEAEKTQSILTCQIHYHSHCGIIVALNSSKSWFCALCPRCMSTV